MKTPKLLAMSLIAFSPLTFSAFLDLPNSVELMALNGVKQDSTEVLNSLPNGVNQLVIQYSADLADGSRTKTYTTKPLVFQFAVDNATDNYKLSHKAFYNLTTAKKAFDKGTMGWALTKNGSAHQVKVEKMIGSGILPFADIEKAVRFHNKEKGVVLTMSGARELDEAVVTLDEKTGKVEITGDAVTQLKLWYTKASKEEQKEFRRWMIDQE